MDDVVVTGVGVISSIGCTPDDFWAGLAGGALGIRRATPEESEGHAWISAPVDTDFGAADLLEPRLLAGTDRHTQMLLAACERALAHSGLETLPQRRTAIVTGTAMGGLASAFDAQQAYDRGGVSALPSKIQIQIWPNQGAYQIAARHHVHGPQLTLCTACASSLDAIGTGARFLESGVADVALVGGSDAHLRAAILMSAGRLGMGSRSDDPARACTPFDVDRAGIVVGEGAGVLVLEHRRHARERGATPLAAIRGYASMGDAYHPTSPDPSGEWQTLTMAEALADAGASASDLSAVVAHGTGTKVGDASEIAALNRHLGAHASATPVTSIKGNVGHTSGAAGVMSVITAIDSLRNGRLVPTAGTRQVDPAAEFPVVIGEPAVTRQGLVQVNAFGTGGQNASLILGPVE